MIQPGRRKARLASQRQWRNRLTESSVHDSQDLDVEREENSVGHGAGGAQTGTEPARGTILWHLVEYGAKRLWRNPSESTINRAPRDR